MLSCVANSLCCVLAFGYGGGERDVAVPLIQSSQEEIRTVYYHLHRWTAWGLAGRFPGRVIFIAIVSSRSFLQNCKVVHVLNVHMAVSRTMPCASRGPLIPVPIAASNVSCIDRQAVKDAKKQNER
ncbi:hypothetical protein XANCAGTX0491_000577 [Xanthoria calcicola]